MFHQEYVFLMGVLDESKSWYMPKMDRATATQNHIKHTINGYTNGSVPGQSVRSSLITLSSADICRYWLLCFK